MYFRRINREKKSTGYLQNKVSVFIRAKRPPFFVPAKTPPHRLCDTRVEMDAMDTLQDPGMFDSFELALMAHPSYVPPPPPAPPPSPVQLFPPLSWPVRSSTPPAPPPPVIDYRLALDDDWRLCRSRVH